MDFRDLLIHNPVLFVIMVAMLLYSIIAHEVAHGFAALLFGDSTAKRYGRLTLNPISPIDILGALMLFVVGFGWAKPVPIDYGILKHTRFGMLVVALAGCATNIAIAFVMTLPLQFPSINSSTEVYRLLSFVARINIILGSFNLIPIPPLDGSKILMWFLPEHLQIYLMRIESYGFFILALLLITGVLDPVIVFMQNAVSGMIRFLIGFFS